MRNISILFLVVLVIFISCTPEKVTTPLDGDALLGTWELVKYIDHANGGTDWVSYGDDIIYQKHVTPTHFTWMKYKKTEDELEGIGGGSYQFADGVYTEDIKFFLPTGSSELGQAIPFNAEIDEEGLWHHDGYAKRIEFDVDAGEMVVVDSVKIEEVWRKLKPEATVSALAGTWSLESYRPSEGDSLYSEYPSFIGYMKLLTPSHFVWIKYNKEGDEVMAAASGTYAYQADVYVENIETCYPKGEGIVGTSPEFDAELEADTWHHLGQIYQLDSAGSEPTTSLIDEIWTKKLE